MNDVLK